MIIGITGRSGDGKTTVANILSKKIPKSKIIEVDDYNIPIFLKSPKLIELYGPEIIKEDFINIDLFLENLESFKKIHELTNDETEECTINMIKKFQEEYDNIIIDWVRLPSLTKVWDLCDYRILVKSKDREKRYANMFNREKDRSNCSNDMDKELEKRDKGNLDYHSYSYDFILENDYTNSLNFDVGKVLTQIKNGDK